MAAHGAAVIYACHDANTNIDRPKEWATSKVIDYPYSVENEQDTLSLIDEALNSFGRVDVWVCSNSQLGPASIEDTAPPDLYKCFEANSLAPFFALKYAPHAMEKTTPQGAYANSTGKNRPYGSIIVVSSTATQYGGFWGTAYTMSCHAALGVVRSGVATLKGTGIRINCVSAGQIDDDQTERPKEAMTGLERPGKAEEVARVCGFLSSEFSAYVHGANLIVDGGSVSASVLMRSLSDLTSL